MFGAIGLPELIIVLVIAVMVFGPRRISTLRLSGSATDFFLPRLAAFLGGVLESLIWFYASTADLSLTPDPLAIFRSGLSWLVPFELISATRARLRPSTFPAYIVFVAFVRTASSTALLLVPGIGADESFRPQLVDVYSSLPAWFGWVTTFPYNVANLFVATVQVLASYVFFNRIRGQRAVGGFESGAWTGVHGGTMSASRDQTTRLLCASAVLLGSTFRSGVLGYFDNRSRATPLELGVDMRAVMTVCEYVEARRRRFDWYFLAAAAAGAIALGASPPLGVAAFMGAATIIYFLRWLGESQLADEFRPDRFGQFDYQQRCPSKLKPHVDAAVPNEEQNLLVYTGYGPFAGAGSHLGGWSFTADVQKAAEGFTKVGVVEPEKVYAMIADKLSASGIEGLTVRDLYLVSGREIRGDRQMLPDIYGRPLTRLDASAAQSYSANNDHRVRRYRWIRIHDWGQELVFSCFVRCSLRGGNLFVEVSRYLLTPLAGKFRRIDSLPRRKAPRTVGAALSSVLIGPLYAAFSPLILFGRFSEGIQELFGGKVREHRRQIDDHPDFDYGAGQGTRSASASGNYEHYFQQMDGEFYSKVLVQVILDEVIEHLDEAHVDTSGLRERQTMILNSGIIVQGGDVKAESLAVGAGARATKMTQAAEKVKKGAAT